LLERKALSAVDEKYFYFLAASAASCFLSLFFPIWRLIYCKKTTSGKSQQLLTEGGGGGGGGEEDIFRRTDHQQVYRRLVY
jgi:hypothetical protein